MRGRRVAAERGCCDLACGRGTRGGRGGGASVRPLGSGRRWLGARLLCAGWGGGRRWRWAGWAGVACGAAAAPNPRVLVRRAWPRDTLRRRGRCAQPGSHPINDLCPIGHSGRIGWLGLVGSDGLAELRAGLVAAFPLVFGAGEGFAGGLAAGRAEGRGLAHGRVVPCPAEAGASAPGSYRIHRDGLVLWRPEHRPSLAPSVGAGAGEPLEAWCRGRRVSRGESPSQCGVARKREPVSSPRRPRMRRHRSSDSRCLRLH